MVVDGRLQNLAHLYHAYLTKSVGGRSSHPLIRVGEHIAQNLQRTGAAKLPEPFSGVCLDPVVKIIESGFDQIDYRLVAEFGQRFDSIGANALVRVFYAFSEQRHAEFSFRKSYYSQNNRLYSLIITAAKELCKRFTGFIWIFSIFKRHNQV